MLRRDRDSPEYAQRDCHGVHDEPRQSINDWILELCGATCIRRCLICNPHHCVPPLLANSKARNAMEGVLISQDTFCEAVKELG